MKSAFPPGGVRVLRGIFTMQGGTIAGNSVSGSVMAHGGGVYVSGTYNHGETDETLIAAPAP
jgi:hypothetical protein